MVTFGPFSGCLFKFSGYYMQILEIKLKTCEVKIFIKYFWIRIGTSLLVGTC